MHKWKTHLPILALLFIFLFNLFLIVNSNIKWENTIRDYIPIKHEISSLKNDITEAHLWLEEIIGGDRYINLDKDILRPFSHKDFKVFVQNHKMDIPQAQEIITKLIALEKLVEKRLYDVIKHKIGSATDQEFDALFKETLTLIDDTNTKLNQSMQDKLEHRHNYV